MRQIYYFILFVVFNVQYVNAQYVGPDPNFAQIIGVASNKIVFSKSGNIYAGNYSNNNITRYLPNGTIDSSFGNSGAISPSQSISFREENGTDLYLSSSNKVLKYNFNGTSNNSFGNNGECILNIPDNGLIVGLIVNNDKSMYVKTSSTSGYNLFKVLPSGVVDNVFGVKNFGTSNINLSKTNDNTLIVSHATANASEYKLIKYTPQGDLDTTFGNQGILILPYTVSVTNYRVGVIVNSLNEIITRQVGEIRKYNINGNLDNSFGNNGIFSISSITNITLSAEDTDFDVDKNNKILFFSFTYAGDHKQFIARINNNGTPDNTFNANGTQPYYLSPPDWTVNWSTLQYCKATDDEKYNCITNKRLGLASYQQNIIKFTSNFSASLSTTEVDRKNLEIYPNPVSDILNIKLNFNEKLQKINIYSMDGRLVFTGANEKSNIGFLSAGDYILEVKTNKNTYNKKLLKK
ncbi:T9SS type A sorting domain-containing protein [Chryseobacterium sp. SIMBA_038]|uniref:T9SS type A sorting domain-containing protein n=1 Tax=Chryseobacterium sp. SIMBA_038 TaxID=3085780 RepID=UPI00397AF342